MKKRTEQKVINEVLMNERLIRASKMSSENLLKEMGTSLSGYSDKEVERRIDKYGENVISHEKGDSVFKRLFESFVNPFTVVLFILAIISTFTDIILPAPSDRSYSTVVIIVTMVTISGMLKFVQESRSNNSAEKLKEMVKTTATVERVGRKEVELSEIVPGDIVYLSAGDMIPADVRIISSKDLFVSQASLTGESEPVEKYGEGVTSDLTNPLESTNLGFMGSNVVSGSAICIVLATGDYTYFGSMAKTITEKKVVTSFEKGVNSVSWLLIKFMMCMVPVVFFANGLTKGDWGESFLFALSVAVGLTPEMLPMIVTTNLAKGAVKMAKKKTVVKSLNSIQNFGAMDVLCTDKTGTLTQDKVVLEYHLDIHGNEDERVLRHAFLNSFFQTGLKNLMDIAILNYANNAEFSDLEKKYTKVDEIPFDFNRRRMSVVIKDKEGKTQLITKGAVEEMLKISSHVEYKGKVEVLTDEIRKEILATVDRLNNEGMRVIAVSQKNNPSVEGVFSVKDESNMVLMGYLAFLDPPKESTLSAIKALNENGVSVKVLTGDNDGVTKCICRQVGMEVENILLGSQISEMSDEQLKVEVEKTNVFAKLSPQQKARIVRVLRENGHTVGFMGDGINDAAAMHESDVGISVDTAVDIAKESADIILLEKDLMVLEKGVIEGRRTFGNIIKYIKMTASSNFGNMFSVVIASVFLPFLPMLPIQILALNLIYDISCISIPWDNMDEEYLRKPRKWDASSIGKFMVWIGPTSSVFDIATFIIMFFIICPSIAGGYYGEPGVNNILFISVFNAGWFVESLWSQTLVIHMIRTPKLPFIQSRASLPVLAITTLAIIVGTVIPYTFLGTSLGMTALPYTYFPWLLGIVICYMVLATIMKNVFRKHYGELL
ncbi:magnesium-translocating P-type ATPase [Clostridium sp. LIBA-8841]|uniref:magnesium-translocating P-type ATPase n=1 Tax=Clostridium sp. LIBA-8841 TaxID=2987530 RepID=UPI002AC5F97B|nr:magnesium-translocating P-type ATPase [Clostridium sp. LIBA-8841]MDZ5253519.1 magnesium-translocating P-type ATPase [Clostridium sp. LIBA-8841]